MKLETIKASLMKFLRDEEGLTIVEYAVAGGLVTLGVVVAYTNLGDNVCIAISDLGDAVTGGTPDGACDQ